MNDLKKYDTWKNQLTIAINFMSSKDNDEDRVMHSKNDNIKVTINNKTDEVIEKLFQSLLSRNEIGLRTTMKDSDFIFYCIHS